MICGLLSISLLACFLLVLLLVSLNPDPRTNSLAHPSISIDPFSEFSSSFFLSFFFSYFLLVFV